MSGGSRTNSAFVTFGLNSTPVSYKPRPWKKDAEVHELTEAIRFTLCDIFPCSSVKLHLKVKDNDRGKFMDNSETAEIPDRAYILVTILPAGNTPSHSVARESSKLSLKV